MSNSVLKCIHLCSDKIYTNVVFKQFDLTHENLSTMWKHFTCKGVTVLTTVLKTRRMHMLDNWFDLQNRFEKGNTYPYCHSYYSYRKHLFLHLDYITVYNRPFVIPIFFVVVIFNYGFTFSSKILFRCIVRVFKIHFVFCFEMQAAHTVAQNEHDYTTYCFTCVQLCDIPYNELLLRLGCPFKCHHHL